MADNRKPYPQFNSFRSFVIDELDRRKTTYPTPMVAPFVRLTSCLAEPNLQYAFFTLGLHGFDEGADADIFSESYGPKRETVGYAYDMRNSMKKKLISADQMTLDDLSFVPKGTLNPVQTDFVNSDRQSHIATADTLYAGGAHPIPGITSVSVTWRGIGLPITVNVEWKCYNRAQLEYTRQHFLTAGNYVVIEWGQQFSDKKLNKILDFSTDSEIRQILVDSILKGRNYIIDNWITPNDGNYNFLCGKIANFNVDIDSATNIYTCSTTIVGVGEKIYGISADTTFVRTSEKDGAREESSISTMHDFFKPNLKFDILINQYANDPSLVASNFANWSKQNQNKNESSSDLKDVSFNPQDYRFVSWKFFTTVLMPELFKLVDHENVRNDLPRIANFWPSGSVGATDPAFQDWVGDNPFLMSAEPDTMLIIKADMVAPQPLKGAGYFGDGTGYRGSLTSGVWLNAGMIRQCFMEVDSFERGLAGVLLRMSGATGNFWGLQLFWDDETARFKILDMKYTDAQKLPPFWKFNDGAQGETLHIKFESAFPKELVSQMMMYAQFKNETRAKREDLVRRFPMIGTTSTFMFAVNYTSFHDILGPDLETASGDKKLTALSDTVGARNLTTENNTVKSRVVGDANVLTAGTVTNGGTPHAGQNLGALSVKLSDALTQRNALTADSVRNSVAPVIPSKAALETPYRGMDRLDRTFRSNLETLLKSIENLGHTVFVNETWRTQERQDSLWAKGRTEPGPVVTHINPSPHQAGLAADLVIDHSYDKTHQFYHVLVSLCDQCGLETVGDWDSGHVQLKGIMHVPIPVWARNILPENSFDNVIEKSFATTGSMDPETVDQQANLEAIKQANLSIQTRFGDETLIIVQPMVSTLVNMITKHGLENYPTPNGFVGGFPTTTIVNIDVLGIAGMSISDGFFVDKLPFIFERSGVFQTTELTDNISENGWVTTIRGVFKLCWLDGTGHPLPPITSKPQ